MNTIKDLQGLSEKIYLCLNKPEEEENVSDHLSLAGRWRNWDIRAYDFLWMRSEKFIRCAEKLSGGLQ